MKKISEYKPEGMIELLPALRKDYKRKNKSGGRYVPVGYIGAGIKWNGKSPWERGIETIHDISIRLVPSEGQLDLALNIYNGRHNGEVK